MSKQHFTQAQIISILEDECVLGDIRQRLGAEDENDTSRDEKIMELDARNLVATQSAWNLGDEQWALDIIDLYNKLKKRGL